MRKCLWKCSANCKASDNTGSYHFLKMSVAYLGFESRGLKAVSVCPSVPVSQFTETEGVFGEIWVLI